MNSVNLLVIMIAMSVIAVVSSKPANVEIPPAKVESRTYNLEPDGSFEYSTEYDDGTFQKAKGTIKEVNGQKVLVIEGSYSFFLPNDERVYVEYIGDENGYTILKYNQNSIQIFLNLKLLGSLVG